MTKDLMKRATTRNFTAWDIDCKYVAMTKERRNLKRKFIRTARRNLKQELTLQIPLLMI